jgi:hypothetical protein
MALFILYVSNGGIRKNVHHWQIFGYTAGAAHLFLEFGIPVPGMTVSQSQSNPAPAPRDTLTHFPRSRIDVSRGFSMLRIPATRPEIAVQPGKQGGNTRRCIRSALFQLG